jgi:DNA replication and repair protein RecF
MSELDRDRREALVEVLRAGGQAVITTTDVEHVPGVADLGITNLVVAEGSVREGVVA